MSNETTAAGLLAYPVSQRATEAAEVLMGRARYTTTAIEAMAQFHEVAGDSAGAALLREFAARFAAFEVTAL